MKNQSCTENNFGLLSKSTGILVTIFELIFSCRKISQHLINHRKLLLVYLFPFCQCLFDNNSIDTQATHHWFLGKESRGSKSS